MSEMTDAEKIKAVIESIRGLEGVALPYGIHSAIREVDQRLSYELKELESATPASRDGREG